MRPTEHDRCVELFESRALVLNQQDRRWGLHEIASVLTNDDGDCSVELCPATGSRSRLVETVHVDQVISFVAAPETEWVKSSVGRAYAIYQKSERSDRDWDTFQVTVRLLV